jgi:hypothetical protein
VPVVEQKFLSSSPTFKLPKVIPVTVYRYEVEEKILVRISEDLVLLQQDQSRQPILSTLPRLLSRMTPNTVTVSLSGTGRDPDYEDSEMNRYDVKDVKNYGILPPIISSMQFTRVEHPDGYRMFDYEGSIFPSTYLLLVNQRASVFKRGNNTYESISTSGKEKNVSIVFTAACTHAVAQLSLFSPLGTTYMSLGPGLCLIHNESAGRPSNNYLDNDFVIKYGHRAFITSQFYFGLDADQVIFGNRVYRRDGIQVSSLSSASFLIGYYVPDAEGIFGRTWKALF